MKSFKYIMVNIPNNPITHKGKSFENGYFYI